MNEPDGQIDRVNVRERHHSGDGNHAGRGAGLSHPWCWRRRIGAAAVVIGTIQSLAGATLAAELPTDDVVALVRKRFQENYAPVKNLQTTVLYVSVDPAAKVESKPSEPPSDGVGLTFETSSEVRWSVTIAGENERYGEKDAELEKTLLRRGKLELDYVPGKYARLDWFKSEADRDRIHHDPREAMFMSRSDTNASLLAGNVRRAVMLTDRGKKYAHIEAKSPSGSVVVLECPESANFLPTQTYLIDDSSDPEWKGVVQHGATVEYGRHIVGGKTVLFPKRIQQRFAGGQKSHKTEGYMRLKVGQVVTMTMSDTRFNAELAKDAFLCPKIPADVQFYCDLGPDRSEVPAELRDRVEAFERELKASGEETARLTKPLQDMVGKPAPALPDAGWIGARPDLAGQPYLLAFWATSCGPCKNDFPTLRRLAASGARIVGMHPFGPTADEVAEFIDERKLGYPTVLATEDKRAGGIGHIGDYPAPLFPHYILVDAQGRVAEHGSLSRELIEKLTNVGEKTKNP